MKKLLRLLYLFILLIILISCKEDVVDSPIGNQPPETGLFLYPDSTINQQPSRLSVHWWGDDPDGLIAGFYFMWEGIDTGWIFTRANDSTFSLPIGSADTSYTFLVAAVDASGNGQYDSNIFQNGIDFGSEPFTDSNGDGIYNSDEDYSDLGIIDPTPARLTFPIKNTPPVVQWNELTVLPDTSFPVMTFKWDADDLDGTESIRNINISLNDTTNFVSLDGSIRLVTLRIKDINSAIPEMEILINGSDQSIYPELLPGLLLDDDNKFYVQAIDLSGASSELINLPDSIDTWFVKKPKGQLLIFDDFHSSSSDEEARLFYNEKFSTIGGNILAGKFDVYDLFNQPLPFENVTILETMKLFKYTFWYSGSDPRLDLLNIVTNKYLQVGNKIAFSMTFQDSSSNFAFDLSTLQGFLPIDSVSEKVPPGFLLPGADIIESTSGLGYPPLETTITIAYIRKFVPNSLVTTKVYELSSSQQPQMNGNIGFITNDKIEFFIGIPLHQCDGGEHNVDALLEKVFFDEFGLMP